MTLLSNRKLAVLCCALLVVGFSTAAFADPVTINLAGPINSSTNPVVNSVYVGPYAGTINGSSVLLTCDDYNHEVSVGQVWTANISTFTDLSHTRFWNALNPAQSLKNYEMAAWLTAQMFSNPKSSWGDISFAIWKIFAGNTPTTGNSSYWLSLASQNYQNFDYSNFKIYTPTDSSAASAQEYIVMAPEPAGILLLGIGLLGLFFVRRKHYIMA